MTATTEIIEYVDQVAPGLHWVATGILLIAVPVLLWLTTIGFGLRKDRRETRASMAALMGQLVEQQRAELTRRVAEGDVLRRQIDLFISGRWELQRTLDEMREQMIVARTLIHDYERRLGLPDTAFPPLPPLAVIPRAT